MIAGLAFQVLTLLIFILLCIDFSLRTFKRHRSLGASALDQNPLFVKLRASWQFKGFLVALALATVCVFWRSVYRVVELGEGWTGQLIRKQWLFVGFEGVMVVVACAVLNVFHPGIMFREAMEGKGGLGSKRREKKKMGKGEKSAERSASGSDVEAGAKSEGVVF